MRDYGGAALAGVKKEMAQPRVAKSARKEYARLDWMVVWRKAATCEAAESHFEGKPLNE
jgi:hypothetical protein